MRNAASADGGGLPASGAGFPRIAGSLEPTGLAVGCRFRVLTAAGRVAGRPRRSDCPQRRSDRPRSRWRHYSPCAPSRPVIATPCQNASWRLPSPRCSPLRCWPEAFPSTPSRPIHCDCLAPSKTPHPRVCPRLLVRPEALGLLRRSRQRGPWMLRPGTPRIPRQRARPTC